MVRLPPVDAAGGRVVGRKMESCPSFPLIRRARGYRLYDQQGKVYLDLGQAGGHALLGHRAFRLTTVLKNTISRGTLFDLPSVFGPRLEKALSRKFSAFGGVRLASSLERAAALASRYLQRELRPEEIEDPVRSGAVTAPVCLWRPFAPAGMDPAGAVHQREVRVLIPVLPFAMGGAPVAVLFREPPPEGFPASEPLSPVLLSGTVRALADLDRYRAAPWVEQGLPEPPPRGWIRRGIYVLPDFEPSLYPQVFAGFLDGGVLLSSFWQVPSVLPAEASAGELQRMRRLFQTFPGG